MSVEKSPLNDPIKISTEAEIGMRGRLLALAAVLMGWMFDGFEMGLFPVIARPALRELLVNNDPALHGKALEDLAGAWNGIAIACFLFGAAAGGVLFGWLGDRLGRVRAMSLSILTYALVGSLGAFAQTPLQIVAIRFVAALGMGGEWSLGVALVMEVWSGRSRALLAGLIGAAGNLGYALVASLSLALGSLRDWFSSWGLSESWVEWRMLMLCGVLPALLTFFVRQFVPESQHWEKENRTGRTDRWKTYDLGGVFVGVLACFGIIAVWSYPMGLGIRLALSVVGLAVVGAGYTLPVIRYLYRTSGSEVDSDGFSHRLIFQRLAWGVVLSAIPLLGTWSSVQWATFWADQLAEGWPQAKAYTQLCSALAAVVGGFCAPFLGTWIRRRPAYAILGIASWLSVWVFYRNTEFGPWFLASVAMMGGVTAAYYGWLPLYLPELFPTRVRATGQGVSFNFGRNLAAIGAMQTGAIMGVFEGGYPQACTAMATIYFLGVIVVWFAPETSQAKLPV